jgi:hypothetical protein
LNREWTPIDANDQTGQVPGQTTKVEVHEGEAEGRQAESLPGHLLPMGKEGFETGYGTVHSCDANSAQSKIIVVTIPDYPDFQHEAALVETNPVIVPTRQSCEQIPAHALLVLRGAFPRGVPSPESSSRNQLLPPQSRGAQFFPFTEGLGLPCPKSGV